MAWTVVLLAAAPVAAVTVVAVVVRCRRAGRLIDRILLEELGPQRVADGDDACRPRAERIT
jgi:hypothetical protein